MNVTIQPSRAAGTAVAPPSKSMAHRALICGAFSAGSTVKNVAYSKDIEATIGCLRALGVSVEQTGDTVRLGGFSPQRVPENAVLFCNESGSTLRFLLPLCMTVGKPITLTGSERLFQRPLVVYETIAREQGISFQKRADGVTVCGRLAAGEYTVPGDISSQFITGLMFAMLWLEADSSIVVNGRYESASYVDLTLSALREFGIVVRQDGRRYALPGGSRCSSCIYTVEGDCSNAAFLEALNLLGGAVQVAGVSPTTLQGDRVYRDLFRQLSREGAEIDLSDCPDLAPVCMAMAAALHGGRFTGTARLRIKESDRGAVMAQELQKFGIAVQVEENTIVVEKGELHTPTVPLCGHNDHRIVMSLALLCTLTGGTITGAQAVSKSYPDFFDVMRSLQVGVQFDETGDE